MTLQSSGTPLKYSEIEAEFGTPAKNSTLTSYNVPWVRWTPQTAWVKSSLGGGNASTPNWAQFLVDYGVYPSNTQALVGTPHTAIWRIGGAGSSLLSAEQYKLYCMSDNNSTFTWNQNNLGSLAVSGNHNTFKIFDVDLRNDPVAEHYLTVTITNIDNGYGWALNPAAVGWQLRKLDGTVVLSSLPTTGSTTAGTTNFNYDYPSTGWGSFLQTYAVYPSNTSGLTNTWHETTYLFNPSAGIHTIEGVADAQSEFYLGDANGETLVLTTNGNETCSIGSCNSASLGALSNQTYKLRVRVYNGSSTLYGANSWFNPGGVGFIIKNSSGTIIKSSLDTGGQGSIVTASGTVSFGNYRISETIGELSNLPLDTGIPQSGTIRFSDFYSKSLNVIVDCFSGATQYRINTKNDKWNNDEVEVVGGFRSKKEGGSKVIIHVNKSFGSTVNASQDTCALKTGTWGAVQSLTIDMGSNGVISGAGGKGGDGDDGNWNRIVRVGTGDATNAVKTIGSWNGGDGNSGLGIQHNPTTVNITKGIIQCGYGGGAAGQGSGSDGTSERLACAGGGGGGAGLPGGPGGEGGKTLTGNEYDTPAGQHWDETTSIDSGDDGGTGTVTSGGTAGEGGNNDMESAAKDGGVGGDGEQSAGVPTIQVDVVYIDGDPNNDLHAKTCGRDGTCGFKQSDGTPGSSGAAIRRVSGYNVIVNQSGSGVIGGVTNATGVA